MPTVFPSAGSDAAGLQAARRHVSVVVASNRPARLLDDCLRSLVPQCAAAEAELIVVRAADAADISAVRSRYPAARVVDAGRGRDIPRLRALGLATATGTFVALTEDHCVADPQWLKALSAAATDADVVGGGMGNAQTRRAVDCGAYFAEYGFFDASRPEAVEPLPLLTGANVAYARPVVADVARLAGEGYWESVIHRRLAERGCRLRFVPGARISQNTTVGFAAFCLDRYQHGRDHARVFAREADSVPRWARVAGAPLVPVLLLWRLARVAAPGHRIEFLRALPFTAAFLTAWAVGEAVGYAWKGHE